jgi:serine/threonine protein kinase
MNFADFTGQTLDDKYKIERELGRGGMGTVYLATHLGTERPVAVKIIAPQFMQRAEFVERFRREARAAGRLRHPNVVDVTDFGFSNTNGGQVAYLVMEYLDGCTLGEILEEEKNLPVGWTLDILEQVCSAVHEAHEQGIIHRDLKPDNIWLEPNQRGGYTVKVLDFGIAKLEETMAGVGMEALPGITTAHTLVQGGRETIAEHMGGGTLIDSGVSTQFSERATVAQGSEYNPSIGEAGTLIQADAVDDEKKTAILSPAETDDNENGGTRLSSEPETDRHSVKNSTGGRSLFESRDTSHLTRVGAVLGTPLYMSPEQCRGEKLDARSDIYSLAVITYQMLSGKTPFEGDFKDVMEAHKNLPPPPLAVKKVRSKIKKLIYSAMSKEADERPATAEAYASELRAQSEGIGTLLRRAMTIYSEHLPKFLGLAVLLYIPAIIVTILNITVSVLYVTSMVEDTTITVLKVFFMLLSVIITFFCSHLIVGTTTWLVNQILAFPLRPVRIRPALEATRKNWKKLIGTGILAAVLTFVGYALCFFPGLVLSVLLALVAPVVMMENLKGFAAFKRSKALVMRSLRTTTAAVAIIMVIPFCVASITSFVVAVTVKAFSDPVEKVVAANKEGATGAPSADPANPVEGDEDKGFKIDVGNNKGVNFNDPKEGGDAMMKRVKEVTRESSTAILMLPFQMLIASLSSIIGALLYLKTRQAGGESMQDLMDKFEAIDRPRKKWQERVRQRLIQSGKITSRSS